MGRRPTEKDYGLPRLTFAEGARVLGIDEGAFMNWVMKTARPSQSEWSMWTSTNPETSRGIPEKLIRLYLSEQRGAATDYQAQFQRLREEVAARDAAEKAAARKAQQQAPSKRAHRRAG